MMADFRRLQMILVLVSDEAEAENRIDSRFRRQPGSPLQSSPSDA